MKKVLFVAIGLVCIQFTARSQDQIKGYWLPEEGKSVIEIYAQDADRFSGKIVWMERAKNKDGELYTDRKNPEKALRDRSILGLDMLYDLIYANDTWSGKLYTPKKGMTLDATLSLVSDDRLKLTVSFRGFTKDQYWSRTVLPE